MRSSLTALICLGLTACGSVNTEESPYVKPNQLMGREIQDRIAQIPYQQREELVANLMWLSQSGEQAIPSLLQARHNDSPKVRSNVLWVLGRIRDRRTIPEMQFLVQDSDDPDPPHIAPVLLAQIYFLRGSCFEESGLMPEALNDMQQALTHDPELKAAALFIRDHAPETKERPLDQAPPGPEAPVPKRRGRHALALHP